MDIYKISFLATVLVTSNLYADGGVKEEIKTFDSGVSHIKREYHDWTTTKIVDELEPKFQIITCTKYKAEKFDNGRSRFCLRFYSKNIAIVEPQALMSGKGYWPHCDFDRITYKVDSNKPSTIPTQKIRGGSCGEYLDLSNRAFFNEFRNGDNAKLKIHYSRGAISLKGFSDAFEYIVNQFNIDA